MSQQILEFFAAVRAGGDVQADELPEALKSFASQLPWLRDHGQQDPAANLAKVKCPVLILQGERDIQVLADKDPPLLVAALENAGNDDHELIVFPELDHLFKKTTGPKSTGLDYLKRRPVDSGFLDRMVAWLAPRTGAVAGVGVGVGVDSRD
ncbi:MAG TPA: prolyl oligopeptidase family serine peptidase [Planctomycetota bacterium]